MKIYRHRETPMKHTHIYTLIVLIVTICLLTGCTAGPDFTSPARPELRSTPQRHYRQIQPMPPQLWEESQHFTEVSWINPQWWHELGSPRLDALIHDALQASPTLARAQATLRQAQELYTARAGSSLYPQVDANLGAQQQRFSPSSSGQTGDAREFSLYNAGVGIQLHS